MCVVGEGGYCNSKSGWKGAVVEYVSSVCFFQYDEPGRY